MPNRGVEVRGTWMANERPQFGGPGARAYHEGLVPTIFEPYARDLGERLPISAGMRVLETAAGTGVVTRALLDRMPQDARLVATDLSEDMIAIGREQVGDDPRLEWRPANAQALPFPDASFDTVVCQFGVMFFPDKALAMREAKRVLKPGGALLLNAWDDFAHNGFARVMKETLTLLFPADPPAFVNVPFSYSDPSVMHTLLEQAGFSDVQVRHVEHMAVSESAERFARGFVFGTPILAEIQARGTPDAEAVTAQVAARLGELGGVAPHRSPIRALVASAKA